MSINKGVKTLKSQAELIRELTELIKETKSGKIHWNVKCQTTEYNSLDEKLCVQEDGKEWTVDECYVSYYCQYKGKEFLLITYEMIHTHEDTTKTNNLVFVPPLGIRYFDIPTLLPYSIEATQVLIYHIHMLWLTMLELKKSNSDLVTLDVEERKLVIED